MRGECGIGSIMKEIGDAEKQRNNIPIKRSIVDIFGGVLMVFVFGTIGLLDCIFGKRKQLEANTTKKIPYKIEPRS